MGPVTLIVAIILATYWYDWKLTLIIFLFITGNNWERSNWDELRRKSEQKMWMDFFSENKEQN